MTTITVPVPGQHVSLRDGTRDGYMTALVLPGPHGPQPGDIVATATVVWLDGPNGSHTQTADATQLVPSNADGQVYEISKRPA